MADGQVVFEISADGKKATASIQQITQELKKAGIDWEKSAQSSTDSIASSFSGMLKKIVTGISAAAVGKALLNIGKEAISAASDLEEVQNVVDVTFGESGAQKIESWAKKAGQQFGLTETQAKKFTSTLGAMMKSAGMSGEQVTQVSTDLAGLAADMASFYNLDFETSFAKIRSGLSGETEPLKQLGINMSEANLQAFALQKGLDKTFQEMTQGEKTMLRYQYMMQATADAQGDFARTSDGFANATRTLQTNIESLKTKLGEVLLPVVNTVISSINEMFEALSQEKERTVLDDFADIDLKTEEKLAGIKSTAGKARELTDILEGIETQAGKDKTAIEGMTDAPPDATKLDPLTGTLEGVESTAAGAAEAIAGITTPTDEAAESNSLWLATCEELVRTIPGLSSIIDTQTGEIKGGTDAVYAYIDAWEEAQKGIVLQGAHEQKRGALESKFAELPGLELDMTVAEYRVKKARDQLNGLLQKYGIGKDADSIGNFLPNSAYATDTLGLDADAAETLSKEIAYYTTLKGNATEATKAYQKQKSAYDEAVAAYEEEGRVIQDTYGQAIEAVDAWTEAQKESATEAITAFDEALKAVDDYYAKVREGTAQEVGKTLGGFAHIKKASEAYEDAANAAKEYAEKLREAREAGKNALTDDEIETTASEKNAQITAENMKLALQSQLDFINEYEQNMKTLKDSGLISDDILSQLSDGSEESAQYLYAMATAFETGDTATLTEINNMWKEANKGKENFIDTLTQQKLAVDEQYDAMVAKAQEAAKALDVSGTAGESTGKNITAMAEAIRDHVPEVAEQVDSVLAELNRLAAWGVDINVSFGASGGNTFVKPGSGIGAGNVIQGEYETGLDRVPFDGFLASLHEGEGILTAEENRIWQRFKNGQPGMDYDTLGGVMRDNIRPGGNVYLDGRQVGAVVSQIQGNQYRTMQRSGWQA